MAYNPLVSAIIPTFNRRKMLLEAVDSVLRQTYSPIELIVVDDGSDDGTYEACVERKDLTYVRMDCGREQIEPSHLPKSFGTNGVSAARNTGIRHARSEFIALLDSDDLWQPEKIEEQIRYFEKNPDAMICQTEEIWIRKGRRVNARNIHKKYSGDIFDQCLPRCIVSPSAVMFKKALLEKVGAFDETFPVCEDYELWLRIASQFPVGLLAGQLTIKRGGHADQLSNQHSLDYFRIRALAKLLDSPGIKREQRKSVLAELEKKSRVYLNGCRKRQKLEELAEITALNQKYIDSDSVTLKSYG